MFQDEDHVDGDNLSACVLSFFTFPPLMVTEVLICVREDVGEHHISAIWVVSPIVLCWGVLLLARCTQWMIDGFQFVLESIQGCRQRANEQKRTRNERESRNISGKKEHGGQVISDRSYVWKEVIPGIPDRLIGQEASMQRQSTSGEQIGDFTGATRGKSKVEVTTITRCSGNKDLRESLLPASIMEQDINLPSLWPANDAADTASIVATADTAVDCLEACMARTISAESQQELLAAFASTRELFQVKFYFPFFLSDQILCQEYPQLRTPIVRQQLVKYCNDMQYLARHTQLASASEASVDEGNRPCRSRVVWTR
jgi:hypothetical protein